MSEFQEKMEELKQNMSEEGFSPDLHESSDDSNENTSDGTQDSDIESSYDEKSSQKSKYRSKKASKDRLLIRAERLAYENKIRDVQNKELSARVRQQEILLSEKQAQLDQQERHTNAYYQNNIGVREEAIINELRVAKEESDIEKELSLSKALAEIAAEKSTYELYKSIKPKNDYDNVHPYSNDYENYDQHIPYIEPYMEEEPINEALEEFIDSNAWANPNSPQYSQKLRSEVDLLADDLSERLKFNGRHEIIGTPEYFNALSDMMNERYGINAKQEREPVRNTHQGYNSSIVAPVGRSGSSMADQYMSRNQNNTRRSIPLSEAQYRVARNLKIKGFDGKYLPPEEAVKRYAEAAREVNEDGNKVLIR